MAVPARARRHLDPRSVIGTFFTRVGSGRERDHQRALTQRHRRDRALGARVHPGDAAFDGGRSLLNLYGAALIGLGVTFLLVAITEYYTGTRWSP